MSLSFPQKRMRRLRSSDFIRNLVRESTLSTSDLIYPIFILDNKREKQKITSMPGLYRLGLEPLLKEAERCLELKIPAIALFPVVEPSLKSLDGSEAYNPQGLVPKFVYELKKHFPELGIITDIALDPYTSHGQDGIIDENGYVLNDETITILNQQAICHAQAGADIVAPSDMMDGRVRAIRTKLDNHGFMLTKILAYSAKYASNFYGPFRDAVGSSKTLQGGRKDSYQLDPANWEQAIQELSLDIEEGADMVMVKPGMPYLDIVRRAKERFEVPVLAYQVSGEFAMIKLAAQKGWLNEEACVVESLYCFKRAGCSAVFTYFAPLVAQLLN